MPSSKTILKFQNYNKQFPIPFVIYADFECFTKPMESSCPNPEKSYSYNYQKHEPSGFCFYIKGIVPGKTFKPILYTKKTPNDDIPSIFVSKLEKVVHKIYQDFYSRPLPLRMTPKQRVSYSKSWRCHICNEDILTPDDKVCDHYHFTGEYHIVEQLIKVVIYNAGNQWLFQWCFTIFKGMMLICLLNSYQS